MERSYFQNYGRVAWLVVLGMSLLFVDFFSKAYVYHVLPFFDSCPAGRCLDLPVFHDFLGIDFYISLAVNRGAAWGFFADFQSILVAIRVVVILGMFVYIFFINRNPRIEIPLIMIASGALGNVIDFFLYGYVIDFLHFNLWGYHFPIFNFADTCITLGVIWLLFITLFGKRHKNYANL